MLSNADPQHDSDDLPGHDDALVAALAEIDSFVNQAGWGVPARLFALVNTEKLRESEPALAQHLVAGSPDSLSSIEQDEFHAGDDIEAALASIMWPDAVDGAAITLERVFLPNDVEDEIPADPAQAATFVASHPRRQDVRVIVGVLRTGEHHALARLLDHPDDLLSGTDLVPALEMALLHTFDPTTGDVAVSDDMAAKDAHRPAGPAGTRGDR